MPAVEVPAQSFRAFLEGMSACGVGRSEVLALAKISPARVDEPNGNLTHDDFARLWKAAHQLCPRETLALEVGLSVPYGAFGALDFLAGTSENTSAALASLSSYFAFASRGIQLDVEPAPTLVRLRILNPEPFDGMQLSDLFTLGVLLARFRYTVVGPVNATLEWASKTPSNPAEFERIANAPVRYATPVSAVCFSLETYAAPIRSADKRLHETLRALAVSLGLGRTHNRLESAVRLRLRSALAQSQFDAASMARSLGMSERTLHRRLAEQNLSYQQILDAFRHQEALRLMEQRELSLSQIAHHLGFSEQSSFTRAFKRWTGLPPARYRPGHMEDR